MNRVTKTFLAAMVQEEFFNNDISSSSLMTKLSVFNSGPNVLRYMSVMFPVREEKGPKNEMGEQELIESYREGDFHQNFR